MIDELTNILCIYVYKFNHLKGDDRYMGDVIFSRHILGEALGSLTFKELKNLEGRLEKGISRIRSKKVYL